MNHEYSLIREAFTSSIPFSFLVISSEKLSAEELNSEWMGYVQTIKNTVNL
jgi:hypothetical protein